MTTADGPSTADRPLQSRFASAGDSPGHLLWQVTNAWQGAVRAALRPLGLTHVQFVLLATLAWAQEEAPITQRWLADRARVDPMMTSQVLRALEGKGLIERAPHPTDARARSLRASAAGLAVVNDANAAVEAVDDDYFAALGPDAPAFTRMLRHLVHP